MKKLKFTQEEVIGFLEDLIVSGEANQDEQNLYQNYLLYGKLKKMSYTYKHLIEQMRELFEITYQ
jgi:hypothetical protein